MMKKFVLPLVVLLATATTALALNVNSTDKYAWSENIGWLNWSTTEGDIDITDAVSMDGYVWGENVGWISLNCLNTASCGTVNYAVTASGSEWVGYAWGENVGWVSFSCENTASCGTADYAVRSSGSEELIGYAWGENVGWVNMNCDNDASCGAVEFGVRYTPPPTPTPTPTPTATPGGGGGGTLTPTPTPSPSLTPSATVIPATATPRPSTRPTAVPSPSVFPTPSSPPPRVTPPTRPPVIQPPTTDTVGDVLDGMGNYLFGSLCDGPLGVTACGVTLLSSMSILLAFLAALLQSGWIATGFSLFQIIGLRRKTRVWGVVYDSHSKHPIPLAKLELFDSSNRLLETRYADRDGRYGFLTSPASLQVNELHVHVKAVKSGFIFPSGFISAGTDYIVYEHVYRGGDIVLESTTLLNYNIPMDPSTSQGWSWSGFGRGLLGALGEHLLSAGFFIGLVAVPLNWWYAPSTKNLVIGILFFVANGIRMFVMHRPYGVTVDAMTGRLMPFSLVILNDLAGNRQGFAVSDERGRFILSGKADTDYEIIAYTPANISPQRMVQRRVRGLQRFSTQAWITENLNI